MRARSRSYGTLLLLGVLTLAESGCAGSLTQLPDCSTPGTSPRGKMMVGRAQGEDTPQARDQAQARALRSGLEELGVKVAAETYVFEAEHTVSGDLAGESLVSSTIRVKLPQGEIRGMTSRTCRHTDGALGAEVLVPLHEWGVLQRTIRDQTLVVALCSTPSEGACDPAVVDALREAAGLAGLQVKDALFTEETEGFASGTRTLDMGVTHDVAHVLWVRLTGAVERGTTYPDQVYAYTEASWTLQEARDGNVLGSWKGRERYKHGTYNRPAEASRMSLRHAILGDGHDDDGGIARSLADWKVSQGD